LVEKETNQIRLGFRYDSDEHAAGLVNLTMNNLGLRGTMTAIDARLGDTETYTLSHFAYTGIKPRIGARFQIQQMRGDAYLQQSGPTWIKGHFRDTRISYMAGTIFSTRMMISGGLQRSFNQIRVNDPVTNKLSKVTLDYYDVFGMFWLDTQDRANFTSRGISAYFEEDYANKTLGFRKSYYRTQAMLAMYIPFRNRITWCVGGYAGHLKGEDQPYDAVFTLGGVNDFMGLELAEKRGPTKQMAWTSVQWEPWHNKFIVLRGNIGNIFSEWNKRFDWNRYEKGMGVTLGMLTIAGPIQFTLHGGSSNNLLGHFRFGYNF
jgi:NTE family protein